MDPRYGMRMGMYVWPGACVAVSKAQWWCRCKKPPSGDTSRFRIGSSTDHALTLEEMLYTAIASLSYAPALQPLSVNSRVAPVSMSFDQEAL